jgi:serine/threonine-protein kinase BUR1
MPQEYQLRKRTLQKGFRDMSKLDDYTILKKLGQGTFGVVEKATNKATGELVALKQLLNHSAKDGFPITAMREIIILKQLNHENILKIIDMIHQAPNVSNPSDLVTQRGCFYTVSPYMSSDLVGLLENPNISIKLPHIKCFMSQLLHGINYIHENMFLHRDIKAANILVDSRGILKIADFGLARRYHGKPPTLHGGPGGGERQYTGLVVTRWYRPPELLLGERKYTTAVDMWGVGCVFAELFTHKPILVGKSDSHQALLVFSLVGAPSEWSHAPSLPNKTDFNIGLTCKRTLESRFKTLMPKDGIDLLSGLLALDPYKRFNAMDALEHEFFKNDPLPLKPHELPKFEECHEIDKERFKKLKENPRRDNGYHKNDNKSNSHDVYVPKSSKPDFPTGPRTSNFYKNSNGYRKPGDYSKYNGYERNNYQFRERDEYSRVRSRSPPHTNETTNYSSLRNRSPKGHSEEKAEVTSYSSLRNRTSTDENGRNEKPTARKVLDKPPFTSGPDKKEAKPASTSGIFMNQKRKVSTKHPHQSKKPRITGEEENDLSDNIDIPGEKLHEK